MVQERQHYTQYADVCLKTKKLVQAPTLKLLMLLSVINAMRRIPRENDDGVVTAMIEKASAAILALPLSKRASRLMSLCSYHGGMHLDAIGEYPAAAKLHDRSASMAFTLGDTVGVMIARFCAASARVNAALVSEQYIGDMLVVMRETAFLLDQIFATVQSPTTDRWRYYNVPLQLLFAHFWAGETYYGPAYERYDATQCHDRLRNLNRVAPELYATQEGTVRLAYATELFKFVGRADQRQEVEMLYTNISHVIGSGSPLSPIHLATAYYMLGLTAPSDATAMSHLQSAINLSSAPQVRAIAQRELDQIRNAKQ